MAIFFDLYNTRPPRPKTNTPDPVHTKVQQHFAEQLEINRIMKRAVNGGSLPAPTSPPIYGDFTVTSLQDAYALIEKAETVFNSMESGVRARFRNNPIELVDFVQNPDNREEAIRIGLLPKPVKPEPVPVVIAPVEGSEVTS